MYAACVAFASSFARTRLGLAWLVLAGSWGLQLACAPLARAQANGESSAVLGSSEYKELVRRALEMYTLGRWEQSRALFQEAHTRAPNARTLRGLALVCYESRQYRDAIDYATQAIAHAVLPLNPQMRAELEQLSEQARGLQARLTVELTPKEAELAIDGKPAQREPDGTIALDPGEHTLAARASGHQHKQQVLQLEPSARLHLQIALTRQRITPIVHEPGLQNPAEPTSELAALAPWIVVGASAAVAIGGAVMLGLGEADRVSVRDAKAPMVWSDVQGAYERAPTLFALGGVMLGVGIAGVAAGISWKLWLQPQSERQPSAELRLTPAGVQLAGSFN